MNVKTILQWVIVVIAGTCSLVLAKSCTNIEKKVQADREDQPLYRDVIATRREAEKTQRPKQNPWRFSEPTQPPRVEVQNRENTNEVSFEEIR